MKRIILSTTTILALSVFAIGGGDIAPTADEVVVVEPITGNGVYIGLAYGFLSEDYIRTEASVKDSVKSFNENFSTVLLEAGYKFNSYIAIEGRYWLGINDVTLPSYTDAIDAPDSFGLYIKPMYPVTDAFDVYALLGYAWTDANLNKVDGFSWGAGISYEFTDNLSSFLDYVSLYDDDRYLPIPLDDVNKAYDIHTVNVGIVYSF